MKHILSIFTAALFSGSFLAACATSPDKISTAYVSTLKYEAYNCRQIALEMDNVTRRTTQLYVNLEKAADTDAAQMGIGLILFWPTLFFLEGGDGPQAAEYAQLKGEFRALETVSVQKECGHNFKSPEEIVKQAAKDKKAKRSQKTRTNR